MKDRSEEKEINWYRLGYLIQDVARMRSTLFDYHMKPAGITRSQSWVLAHLYRNETNDGMISSDLAKALDVGKVTIGGLIDRLEAQGYVERRPDPQDRRIKRIFITRPGLRVIKTMRDVQEDLNKKVCQGLTNVEIDELERTLALMKGNIRDMLSDVSE